MSDNILVKTGDIRLIAKNIDAKREEILSIYKNDVLPVLSSSEDCLKVSGLKYDDVVYSFNKLFNSLNEQLNSLSSVLVNKIIPGYENSSAVIKNHFNSSFQEQLSQSLSTMNQQ